ncbi:MFS transporter [Streptomyces sp. BE303]|uniref:MFS transporter n=1 Tax=Streptomyces sp. BE303 TaxID=3002528 RepID=UPI002E78B604|nr:MDR family MFS transporter [Streptomyces sp. BE303]MED7947721.1 MFS transporter [Streptomyces sp. BE303]
MDGPQATTRTGGVVATLALTGTVAAIMQTLVTPLIGELPKLLNTTPSNATWVITATLLSAAVFVPVSGRLGDLLGKRRMLLACCVPLFVGSVICALTSSVLPMIVGRGLQGVGMGVVPLGISLLREVLPPERLGSAIALVSASMGIGGGLGLPISAAVAEYASWRVLFWGAAALTVAITAMIWFLVPAPAVRPAGGRFDLVGAIGLGAGLVCLLLPVSKGGDWGWTDGLTLGLFGAAVLLLLAWGRWELRIAEPLVDLRVTARPRVLLTNAASVLVGFGMYAQALIIPQLLQLPEATGYGLGRSMLAMGLWMAPSGLMMMAVSPLGGRLSAARGPKFTLVAGALAIATGYGLSMVLIGSTWGVLVVTLVCNAGVGLAYGAMPALIMSAVPLSETASANSFNTLMRSLGTSLSAAVVGVVLAQLNTTVGGHTLPSEAGFRVGLLIGCGVALGAAAVAATIPVSRDDAGGRAAFDPGVDAAGGERAGAAEGAARA